MLRLQNSQSGTVNGLLEEVKRSEERSTAERKKAAAEVSVYTDVLFCVVAECIYGCGRLHIWQLIAACIYGCAYPLICARVKYCCCSQSIAMLVLAPFITDISHHIISRQMSLLSV